jgi:hypothetical protein
MSVIERFVVFADPNGPVTKAPGPMVRTHVKHLLIKFNCASQALLIRQILLGPVLSMAEQSRREELSPTRAEV